MLRSGKSDEGSFVQWCVSTREWVRAIATGNAAAIPEAQVRLFGSSARGTSRLDSDVDLLITVDLLLCSQSEASQRQQCRSTIASLAYQEGVLLNGRT
jgi:hypothetical protein